MRPTTRRGVTLLTAGVALAVTAAGGQVSAQVPGSLPNPDLQNRIPVPLPPPMPPPIINGPLSQAPPPGVYVPPRLESLGDRAVSCAHQGAAHGLRGRKLEAYTRGCASR
jgi:hypothetical protein